VSLISTVISQAILFAVYPHEVDSAMGGNVIATCVSTVPAYYLNRRWTWGKRGKSHFWKEVMPFWVIALIGLLVSTALVGLAAHNADRVTSTHEGKIIIVHLANLFAYALIWVARYSILNKFLFGPSTQGRSTDVIVDTTAVDGPTVEHVEHPGVGHPGVEHTAVEHLSSSADAAAADERALVPRDPSH
jgi:putative flippase GtrA